MNEKENNRRDNRLPNFMLLFVVLIVVLVALDANFHLIAKTWWYDVLLHIMGGAWIGMLFIYLFSYRQKIFDIKADFWYSLSVIVGFAVLIGTLWEFYEFIVDQFITTRYLVSSVAQGGLADTMKDLADDMIGGALTTIIYFFRR